MEEEEEADDDDDDERDDDDDYESKLAIAQARNLTYFRDAAAKSAAGGRLSS